MEDVAKLRRCPNCGWMDVRRSLPRSFFDRMIGLLGLVPYRCRSCGHRFYRTGRSTS